MVCLLTASHPFVWAHRGAFLETPENTKAAFRAPLDIETTAAGLV
jgi:glycerophosphoryl diester phosphodiesterase